MLITIEKTGGIGGWHFRLGPLDTDDMGEAGTRVSKILRDIHFSALAEEPDEGRGLYDFFTYRIEVFDQEYVGIGSRPRYHWIEWWNADRRPPVDSPPQRTAPHYGDRSATEDVVDALASISAAA